VVVKSRSSGYDGRIAIVIKKKVFNDLFEAYQVLVEGQRVYFESFEIELTKKETLDV